MTKTRKVGITGRFGTRYGVSIRRRIKEVEETMRLPHSCPSCRAPKVVRASKGVWLCRKCGLKFAGGTYTPVVTRDEKE